jgi:hypothetical protein
MTLMINPITKKPMRRESWQAESDKHLRDTMMLRRSSSSCNDKEPGFVDDKHNKTCRSNENSAKFWTHAQKIDSQISEPESKANSATLATPFATVAIEPAVSQPAKNKENGAEDTANLSLVQIEGADPGACITVMHASDYALRSAPDIEFSSRKMHLPPLPISLTSKGNGNGHEQTDSPSPRTSRVNSPRRW